MEMTVAYFPVLLIFKKILISQSLFTRNVCFNIRKSQWNEAETSSIDVHALLCSCIKYPYLPHGRDFS